MTYMKHHIYLEVNRASVELRVQIFALMMSNTTTRVINSNRILSIARFSCIIYVSYVTHTKKLFPNSHKSEVAGRKGTISIL